MTSFNKKAADTARIIVDSKKKDFEHLTINELHDLLNNWARALTGTPQEAEVREALSLKKAEMTAAARSVAEKVVKVHTKQKSDAFLRNKKIAFFAEMEKKRAGLRKSFAELATRQSEEWYTNWSYDLASMISCKAEEQVLAEFVYWVEGVSDRLTLIEAIEHSLFHVQRRLIERASFGLSRSTSTVHNASEDEMNKAAASLLRQGEWYGLRPVDHTDKIRASEA